MTEEWEAPVPTARRAPQHIRLFSADDAYEHLCILTLLPSLGPLHLMLADALSPHGSNATLASVGTLSEGFERFVTSPRYLVGYVRWDARSDQSSFVKQSLQQLSGRNPTTRLLAPRRLAAVKVSGNSRLSRSGPPAGITTWEFRNMYCYGTR
jgi:hypothetical protein